MNGPFIVTLIVIACAGPSVLAQPRTMKPPTIVRLDERFDKIIESAGKPLKPSDIGDLTTEIRTHADIYRVMGQPNPFLYAIAAFPDSKTDVSKHLAETRKLFDGRDLNKEINDEYRRTAEALDYTTDYPPVFYVAYGAQQGTNARTEGIGVPKGAPRVYLNLVALSQNPTHWKTAVLHESVHTMQKDLQPSLLGRSIFEAVPTYISQALQKDLSDADALLWSAEQWRAAEERREAIVQAFAERRNESDAKSLADFLYLHAPLKAVKGAPDRTGYYVGFLAVKAWAKKNPNRPLKDLLTIDPQEVWAAFMSEKN